MSENILIDKRRSNTYKSIDVTLDINEISFQLLDALDPSFWSLQNYLRAVGTISSPYYQELSFNQLVKSYTASLYLQKLRKDNHYYEKTMVFEEPTKLSQIISNCQAQYLESSYKEDSIKTLTSGDKHLSICSTLDQLKDIANQIKSVPATDLSALHQSKHWPNESCISKVAQYFPAINESLPLRKTEEKADRCLAKLSSELEAVTNSNAVNQVFSGFQSLEDFFQTVFKEVSLWNSGHQEIPNTPRKRSFDLVEPDPNDFWSTSLDDDQHQQQAQMGNLNSSLVRVKSHMRKRRRYSIA